MSATGERAMHRGGEATGFVVALLFVGLAAIRDVYLGGLFQRVNPLLVAMVAFSACTLVFLPVAVIRCPGSLAILRRRSRELFFVNVTSAVAWLAFLGALKLLEPSLVQILYSGIGPLSVLSIDRLVQRAAPTVSLTRAERPIYMALIGSLIFAAAVALGGLSGAGPQPLGLILLGVMLAGGGGIAISVSTMQCRRLNDAGVSPAALLALRYPVTALSAAILASLSPSGLPAGLSWVNALIAIAALLIIVPSYVNQVAISFASPLTVRAVLATGPVLIFFVQLVERRLSPSPYSLTAAMLYAVVAIAAGFARHHAIRSALPEQTRVVTVLSTLATREAYVELLEQFERATGFRVSPTWTGTADIMKRIAAGEFYDIVITSRTSLDDLIAQGRIVAGSRTDLARSGIGIAVRAGAPRPEIASAEDLKQALLAARTIGYSTGPSGIYLQGLFDRMGISEVVKAKAKQIPSGGTVGTIVASGDAEIGFQQVSELLHATGIDFIGALPPDVQHVTILSGGIRTGTRNAEAARGLMTFLTSGAAASVLTKHGLEPA